LAGNERIVLSETTTPAISAAIPANTMTLVNAVPVLELKKESRTDSSTSSLRLADIKVSAAAEGGNIKVEKLPINVKLPSDVVISGTGGTPTIVVEDELGDQVAIKSVTGATTGGEIVLELDAPVTIASGSSKTFSIYAGITPGTVTDYTITTSLGAKASFMFTDVNSNKKGITGSALVNYKTTDTSVIKNK